MSNKHVNDPMIDLFIFETTQLIEQLEQVILINEKASSYSSEAINEIFRIMHTIKGSSAMMLFDNISSLAHSMEDLFFSLREDKPQNVDCSVLSDFVLDGLDFIKVEIAKIRNGDEAEGNASDLIDNLHGFLDLIKGLNPNAGTVTSENNTQHKQQFYISKVKSENISLSNLFQATIYFEDGCGMENLRAFGVVNNLEGIVEEYHYLPEDIDNDDSARIIRDQGFTVFIKTNLSFDDIHRLLLQTVFLKNLELKQVVNEEVFNEFHKNRSILREESPIKIPLNQDKIPLNQEPGEKEHAEKETPSSLTQQNIISVSVVKLDKLMDLVGEMVITEAMVTQNPDLKGLDLNNFNKAAWQLRKITRELQDTVMSVRMVPLAATFQKMNRIIRDMCKRLNKEVQLQLIGEETEVDKNIIEHIADPLMHLIRNSIDHGIEMSAEREAKGKPKLGTITLEAKNAGSDVLIIIKDDGEGVHKERILAKAYERGLLHKPESEITEKEIYNLVFLPGFSTNENVTEFSGRGVGMDVVMKNIEAVGGSVSMSSALNVGTTFTLKIPLSMSIIRGLIVESADQRFIVPLDSIEETVLLPRERIRIYQNSMMADIREEIIPLADLKNILKIGDKQAIKTPEQRFTSDLIAVVVLKVEGIKFGLIIDRFQKEQEFVVKALPEELASLRLYTGATILGDGSVVLILNSAQLLQVNTTGENGS